MAYVDEEVLFCVTVKDAQMEAKHRLGRELTEDELYKVKKGLSFGLECWAEVLKVAVEEAALESRG